MFKKERKPLRSALLSRVTALLLSATLLLPLGGCQISSSDLEQGLEQLPGILNSISLLLDELIDLFGAPSNVPMPGEGSSFQVHFIDVGQADCALVVCDGAYMIIDGGNAEDSDLVYTYLKDRGIDHLDYMIATHAHEDHIGGLSGAAHAATVDVAYSPVTKYSTKVFKNLVSALKMQNKALTIPSPGDTFALGSAQVEILGPLKDYDDTNNTSIVLRVDYGETSFLFTGDMESMAETDLVEDGADLEATVLKVGHHGSPSSSSYTFLREVMPEYAVISVGTDNSYGHPSKDVISRLEDVDSEIFRTDLQGTIIASSDGTTVTFHTEK